MSKSCLYRIALTQAGLETGYFLALGLPPVDLVQFQPFANRKPQSLGGQARQGYISCSLFWSRLDAIQANILQGLITAAETSDGDGNGTLYLTLPRTDASAAGLWIDVSGIAVMPEWVGVAQGNGLVYENVTLSFNNLTVEASPSSAV